MPSTLPCRIDLPDEAATSAFGESLAPLLRAGDVLALWGEIGAGKSHFARALIKARLRAEGRDEDVPSPTFTLVQTYRAGALEIWHSDLYRLTHPDEALELGLEDAFSTALSLIEWPDRLGADLPPETLHLRFAPGPTDSARYLTLESAAADWAVRLDAILARRACIDA
ncbi:MAG: tRNA (adenosine(37)-N6)-threonylcarbamoyltransferase complex ATPase subunit type 1 TsaE [Rhodobacteraceae bacterium]|nr:tRNA (adenosine(37)-N6)-threonylcarbamoyltransferase complex ATPase subunit type 1 TsaE [Paracoccaceae bacterium]